MVSRLSFFCVCFSVASVALGLEVDAPSPAQSVMYAKQDDVNAIRAELQSLRSEMTALTKALSSSGKIDNSAKPASVEKRLDALEASQQELLRLGRSQGLVIEQIAAKDDRGQYYPRFNGNSEAARESMYQAIEDTVPRVGKVIVTNNTKADQWITINGDKYSIPAGQPRTIEIPTGNVTSQYLAEQQKFWHLGPSNKYTQKLFLNPTQVTRYTYEVTPIYPSTIGWVAAY